MKLYHYRRLNEWLIQYIADRRLYFQSPLRFNDPFDFDLECLVVGNREHLDFKFRRYVQYVEERVHRAKAPYDHFYVVRVLDYFNDPKSERAQLPGPPIELAVREYNLFKAELEALNHDLADPAMAIQSSWRRLRKQLAENLGVLCFSENPTQLLMWSHYADSHRGVCLEFESDESPVKGWRKYIYHPVRYVTDRRINVLELGYKDAFHQLLTCKSMDWAYEKERRLITLKGSGYQDGRVPSLTAITLGAQIRENNIDLKLALYRALCEHQRNRRPTRALSLRAAEKVSGEFRVAIRSLRNLKQLAIWLGVETFVSTA
jgi:hypothetical protein